MTASIRATLGVALFTVMALGATGCGSDRNAGDDMTSQGLQRAGATQSNAEFRPCRVGDRGGGFRIRVSNTACEEARTSLPTMLGDETTTLVTKRGSERVYRNDGGWTCLVQPLPEGRATQVLCTRDQQLILYRFA